LPCYCYAIKTHGRTTPLVSQPFSAIKGSDMSELPSHHCMFELIKVANHIRTTVHDHPQLSLRCRLPNHINFDVFDRCFCKVETRVCEALLSCVKRLGDLAVTTLPGASRSFKPALTAPHHSCGTLL